MVLGGWIGSAMVRLYAAYYRFPELPFQLGMAETVQGVGICALAALVGTWSAIRRTVVLPPAEAMRPEAPPAFRATLLERLGLERFVPATGRMVLREIERQPRRAFFSIIGIAMATGMTVMNSFTFDSVSYMLNVQYGIAQREDVQVTLYEPRAVSVLSELEHLPGVVHAEGYRSVPVRLRSGAREKSVAILGVPHAATLTVLLDEELGDVPLPPDGLVLSSKLAELLEVSEGDRIQVEVKEGRRPSVTAPVARIMDTFIGTPVYMELAALCALLGETPTMNGAWLLVDEARIDALHAAVKETPVVAGITARNGVLRHVREMIDQNLGTFVSISLAFSLVMAFGVLYNAVRITLSERARELASLRVLGFRRREVAAILLGEMGLLVAIAIPLGLVIGYWMSAAVAASPASDTEQFRLPLIVYPSTYAMATVTVLAAAVVSGWNAWRRLDRFDIVEVLKTRD